MLGTLHLRDLQERELGCVLDAFITRGGQWLDTATLYGGARLLSRIGQHLRRTKARVAVWVKVGYFPRSSDYRDDARFAAIAGQALEAIGPAATVLAVHEADWRRWWVPEVPGVELVQPQDDPHVAARLGRFDEIAGRLGVRLAVSGNHAAPLARVLACATTRTAAMIAKQYDLVWRSAAPLIEEAQLSQRSLVVAAPWHQGWLHDLDRLCGRRPHLVPAIGRVRAVCAAAGLSVAAAALPFLLQASGASLVAFGARTEAEVAAAIAASNVALPPGLFEQLRGSGVVDEPMGPLIEVKEAVDR